MSHSVSLADSVDKSPDLYLSSFSHFPLFHFLFDNPPPPLPLVFPPFHSLSWQPAKSPLLFLRSLSGFKGKCVWGWLCSRHLFCSLCFCSPIVSAIFFLSLMFVQVLKVRIPRFMLIYCISLFLMHLRERILLTTFVIKEHCGDFLGSLIIYNLLRLLKWMLCYVRLVLIGKTPKHVGAWRESTWAVGSRQQAYLAKTLMLKRDCDFRKDITRPSSSS